MIEKNHLAKQSIRVAILLFTLMFLSFPQRTVASRHEAALEKVTLQLKWLHQFQFAGYYAAKEQGFYQEEGLDVEIRARDPRQNNIQQVLDGEAEYGVSDSILLLYRMRGEPVVVLAPIFQQSPLVYMTLRSSGIESPYQLKGKRVMVYPHGTDGLPLEAMFHELGIEEQDFSSVPKTVSPDALENGFVDAYPGYLANEAYYFQKKNMAINIIDPQNYGVDFYGDMLFTSQAELMHHPGRSERFLRASLKGWQYALNNTEENVELILRKYGAGKSREHLQYEADVIRRMVKPDDIPLGKIDRGRLQYIARTFKRLGFTEKEELPKTFLIRQPVDPSISLTDAELQWLKTHQLIKVANETDWPPFDFAEHGVAKGYSIDLLNLIAEKTGLQLEYVNGYSWESLLEMGQRKEVDLFPAMWKTDVREQFLQFSPPYIGTPYILVIHEDKNQIQRIEDLNGRTLAGIKGFASTELVKEHYPDIRVLEVSNAAEGLRLVSYGKIDAYLGSYGETDFEIRENLITHLKIAGETSLGGHAQTPQLHIAVRKDWPELSGIIQKAMDSITLEEKRVLQTTWLQADITRTALELSQEERAWLGDHPILRVAFDIDWPPAEFVSQSGEIDGIAADYLKRMEDLLGVKFETASPQSWKEMLLSFQHKELDFFSAISPTPQRDEWMDFTDPYLSFPIVIVTRKDVPYIGNLDDLGNNIVAVVESYASHDILRKNHPNLFLLPTRNIAEALKAVANGKAFAFIGSLATISHVVEREGLSNLKVSGGTPYTFKITMGVRKGETLLLSLLQKALNAISPHERSAIYNRWIRVNFEPAVDYSLVWKISASALLIVTAILYWNRRLSSLARDLKIAKNAAEAANRAKSVFLANMSHELRTPLTGILGYAQMLEQESDLTESQREGIHVIHRSGEHLLILINDILDFSKIDADRIELHPEEFALPSFLKQLAEMTRPDAKQRGLSFVFEAPENLPHIVYGDQKRLRQVLLNLLRNAVKYTEQGSVVFRVTHRAMEHNASTATQEISGAPSHQRVNPPILLRFEVEDSGVGIASSQLEAIFHPFQQTDSQTLREGSSGLGLTISRRLVQMMGTRLQVASTEGQGSTFFFDLELPVIEAASMHSPPVLSTEASPEAFSHDALLIAMETLPSSCLAELSQGAEEADITLLRTAIGHVRKRNALLADTLAQLTNNFEYETILTLLQQIKSSHS